MEQVSGMTPLEDELIIPALLAWHARSVMVGPARA